MLAKGIEYSQYDLLVKGGNVVQPTQNNHKKMYQIVSKKHCRHMNDDDWDYIFWPLKYSKFHTKILEDDWQHTYIWRFLKNRHKKCPYLYKKSYFTFP